MDERKIVYYRDFGAVGDGKTDDFKAIKACHDYANNNGCTVHADEGATYYIGDTLGEVISIRTDTDLSGATFFIDDKAVPVESEGRNAHIFTLDSDFCDWHTAVEEGDEFQKKVAKGYRKGAKNIGFAPGYPALIFFYDTTNFAYFRYGTNGSTTPPPQRELVVVDKDGNVKEGTELLLNFDKVTRFDIYRIDDEPITVRGGTFITNANNAPPEYTSYKRGFLVHRSNATLRDFEHKVIGEGEHGAPCSGFVKFISAHNLLCENLILQSHKTYCDFYPDGKIRSRMGSYDINGEVSASVVFKNCTQSNFFRTDGSGMPWNQNEYWGIMGSNYCKDITFEGCLLSRFDAHSGIYNVTIRDTTINNIHLIGGGKATIERTVSYGGTDSIVYLRGDYGSTWNGDIIIKDCTLIPQRTMVSLVRANYYNIKYFSNDRTHRPNITVDNLKIKGDYDRVPVFWDATANSRPIDCDMLTETEKNNNVIDLKSTVTVKNNESGYVFYGSTDEYVNERISIITE